MNSSSTPSSVSMYDVDSVFNAEEDSLSNSSTIYDTTKHLNQIDFTSSRPIEHLDLDVIISFLENPKQSGGGSITEFTLEPANRIQLTVNYENKTFKQRVLAKGILKFQNYSFLVNEPLYEHNYKYDNQVLILSNINHDEDIKVVQMFAETLILSDNELNDVLNVKRSLIFQGVFYIKFKAEFDIEQCKKRLERRATLRDRKLDILQAFQTNTIILKFIQTPSFNLNKIEQFFLNKRKFSENPISSMNIKGSYLLIKFNSTQDVKDFLNDKHKHGLFKNIQFEYLYSSNLINEDTLDENADHTNSMRTLDAFGNENEDDLLTKLPKFNFMSSLLNKFLRLKD